MTKEATMNTTEIRESDLREALERAAAANNSSTDTLAVDVALAHWRKHPGVVAPNDNDGYAVELVDQVAVGYVLSDGPWWVSDGDIRALEMEAGTAGDAEQVELCRAALDESDVDARSMCVDVIARARIERL